MPELEQTDLLIQLLQEFRDRLVHSYSRPRKWQIDQMALMTKLVMQIRTAQVEKAFSEWKGGPVYIHMRERI